MKYVALNKLHLHNLGTTCGVLTSYTRENCALLGYYAKSSSNFLPTFRDNLSVLSFFWVLEP